MYFEVSCAHNVTANPSKILNFFPGLSMGAWFSKCYVKLLKIEARTYLMSEVKEPTHPEMKVNQLRKLEKNASREGKRFVLQTQGAREKLLLISKLEGKYVQRGMVETM